MDNKYIIRRANINDTLKIESIFKDVVLWMQEKGIENLWNEKNTKWENLSK